MAGCGGGGGASSSTAPGSGSGTAYNFVTPTLNSTRNYAETIVDNSNNSIDVGFADTIMTVNADGSYVVLSQDPSHNSVIVDGTNYSIVTQTDTLNGSGQETGYVYTAAGGSTVTCAFDPHGSGPDFPIRVGATWTLSYTFACGSEAPVTYTQQGSVVDVESVTVPAGTYSALKLQSTVTWTDAHGTTRTETITNWREVATSFSVKEDISIAYSGTLPAAGYAVSRSILLQSTS
jgi:hypothetical protein